jgi:ATP-dependent helicase/DNAse subunit B
VTTDVLVGPGAALWQALLDEVGAQRGDDAFAPVNIVVPSNTLAIHLGRDLAADLGGILNVRRLTFVQLVKQLAGPEPGGRPLVSEVEMLAAIRRAVEERPGYFSPVANQTGLLRAILSTVTDLENSRITAEDLEALAVRHREHGSPGRRDAERLQTLASVYSRTHEFVGSSFESAPDLFARALASINEIRDRLGSGRLLVYGFHDFTELQLDLLAAIGKVLDVQVFCADERSGGSTYAARTVGLLAARGFASRRLEPGAEPMQRLASALFGAASAPVSDAAVEFTSVPNQAVEVEHCARRILQLLESGVSTDDIAVVYRGEDYPNLLTHTFSRAGLRAFLVGGNPLAETRYGKSLLLMLRMVGSELRRSDVIEFATFCPIRTEVLSPGESANWERITRKAAIVRGPEQWDRRLQAYADELRDRLRRVEVGDDDSRDRLELAVERVQRLREFVLRLSEHLRSLDKVASWSGHSADLLEAAARYLQPVDGSDGCTEAIRQLGRLDILGGSQPSFASFCEAVSLLLESARVQNGRIGRGHIFVGRPRDLRGLRFAHVLVVGLAERSFPAPSRVDSILLESERRSLAASGLPVPQAAQRLDEERLLFSSLVAASGRVYASFPRFDENKPRPRYPSAFFLGLAEAMHGRSFNWKLDHLEHHSVSEEQPDRGLDPAGAMSVVDYDRAILTAVDKPTLREVDYLDSTSPHFRAMRTAYLQRNSRRLTNYDGWLSDSENLRLVAARLTDTLLSPTSLEQYATCPQRYFLRYLLGLEEVEDPGAVTELSPLERGTIVHQVLERFYIQLRDSGGLPLNRERRFDYHRILDSVADQEIERAESRGVTGAVVSWRSNQRLIKEELARFLDSELQEATLEIVPHQFEVPFGESHESALHVRLAEGIELRFRGQIDRIDRADNYARVIDYKTGKSKARTAGDEVSFYGGRQLQLPIYLLAAARELGLAEDAVDAHYVHINREAGFGRRSLTGASFVVRRPSFERILRLINEGMTNGVFVARTRVGPKTARGENCRFCDFRTVCSPRVGWQEDNKAGAPVLKTLNDLRSIE